MITTVSIILSLHSELQSQGFVCAVGGGSENYNDWSDAPYGWIVQKSDSGKIVIISDADATQWLPTYFMSLGADTAYKKTIPSIAAANLQSTYDELVTANAIFIRGGDQWDYIRLWKGTKVDSAINYVFNNGGVIAGTSAGAAVLGDVDFSAKNGSAYPDEALKNPFYSKMQFEDNFLNLVPNVLFDTHFIERGRHGRLIAMLYNQHFNTGHDLIGIGIDDKTAFCISPDGICEVMGSGAAAIFSIDSQTILEPVINGNYIIGGLKCDQLTNGWKYNIHTKEIVLVPESAKQVDISRNWQLPAIKFWLTGSDSISEHLTDNFTNFIFRVNASYFVIISHIGYASRLLPLLDFLNQTNLIYDIVYLSSSNQNDPAIAQTISNATGFVFVGHSLGILSSLNDINSLVGQTFQQKISGQTPIFFFGRSGKIIGAYYTDNLYNDYYAAYRGKMTNNSGLNLFGDALLETSVFDDNDYYENKVSSVLWGMMRNRKRLGIYLHGDAMAIVNLNQNSINCFGTLPPIFIDASQTTYVDSSTYRASSSVDPRQVVAMNNLRYGVSTYDALDYMIESAWFEYGTSVKEDKQHLPTNFFLYQNYPNPFNPTTIIRYQSLVGSWQTIKVFDVLGNEVATLVDEYKPAGKYEIEFNPRPKLASGVYFYRFIAPSFSKIKSMVLIK